MICQKCDRQADYKIEELSHDPEHKTYILCTRHYMDLNRFLVAHELGYLFSGKGGDTNGTKSQ